MDDVSWPWCCDAFSYRVCFPALLLLMLAYLRVRAGDVFQHSGGVAVGAAARQPVGDVRVRDG